MIKNLQEMSFLLPEIVLHAGQTDRDRENKVIIFEAGKWDGCSDASEVDSNLFIDLFCGILLLFMCAAESLSDFRGV